ncbi:MULTISPECIES: DEAD/DEAH box helicase [unclassified Rhizobium]|uniref:SNF2-related protein n=1 Tax=unclassified Rhizobium TaxID=2613769 RepID=UPI001C82C79E|nr:MULTISPECIES: DEAD/DEAH box helicase [unclassified Rhizobium]MBX5248781.1 DEAD/DEAH box helicase [Rhizobium sp. NLR3b]MBX5309537.1 DEAD/DEAH box helicase [Rhizobium sp. NLR14b]
MNEPNSLDIYIEYIPDRARGVFRKIGDSTSPIWERLNTRVASNPLSRVNENSLEIPWADLLGILRDYGTAASQREMQFRFRPEGSALEKIQQFVRETTAARASRGKLTASMAPAQIESELRSKGFSRELRPFQLRDLGRLLSLPHGANFSVPGAGKTTVTFALHLLANQGKEHLLVVAPKAAFPAWRDIISECMSPTAPLENRQLFKFLDGTEVQNDESLRSGHRRFVISYDLLVRQQGIITAYLMRQPVHMVLDESHRMKAGVASQRGALLMSVSSLPVRRDILSGTPMPQHANDMASQLAFLWPGQGLDLQIERGVPPREVLGSLYVRTTKSELGLAPARRFFHDVGMSPGQLALYGVVRSEILRQLTKAISSPALDFLSARKSVMRLLQLSVNPTLALQGMARDRRDISSGIADKVIEEGASEKMRQVCYHARKLGHAGRKVVIWTIFTQSILDLELLLADLNPVSLYGGVPSGAPSDPATREGRLLRFHEDGNCKVMIANPAAAGEGISLHTVCHDAIYLDRSYVSTHYLQSIDRIHRLGLPAGVDTNIHIYRTKAPAELGSVDLSVSRRLATKIRGLQNLLDDTDLHALAFDEENADDPVDYDTELQDLVDLVEELEGQHTFDEEEA